MNKGRDPLTNEVFVKKRNNQIFANRENQIRFNNLKAQKKRNETSQINQILNKNHNILKAVLSDENEIIKSLDYLLGAGFNFGVHTHTIKKDEKKWTCVYDYAYTFLLQFEEKRFKIIQLNS